MGEVEEGGEHFGCHDVFGILKWIVCEEDHLRLIKKPGI